VILVPDAAMILLCI